MSQTAATAKRILKKAYGNLRLFFNPDGSFAKLFTGSETVYNRGDLSEAVDSIYGDDLPTTITLHSGLEQEYPGQGKLFDTGEDDERFKSVRERQKPNTIVLSVGRVGNDILLTVVKSDYGELSDDDDGLLKAVVEELHERDVYAPWESGEGLAGNVDTYLDYGSDIPSEFYEDRYDWDDLIEPYNEYWANEFDDDVRQAVEKLLDNDDMALHGGEFNGSIGEVVAELAAEGPPSVISPEELADELKDSDDFRHYEERGHDDIDEITGPILEEIRETWKNRQLMRQDNKTFDAMRDALDGGSPGPSEGSGTPIELPPNSDAVLRMLGAFKKKGWESVSFRDMVKEFPDIAGQERFWKAVAKGSPKLTPDRLQAYLDGDNPKAMDMLPKSFGGKAVNPPEYKMVAEDDYEGYTISNMDEHMLGVAALYVENFNENASNSKQTQSGQPYETKGLIVDAMKQWHSSAHPLSDGSRGVGWIRYDLIKEEDGTSVMFIQEIQSDFMWAVELAAAGRTPNLGGGFPDSWEKAARREMSQSRHHEETGEFLNISPDDDEAAVDSFNKKLAQYILKKFQGWDHYLLGNLMTTARQNGVDKVVMNTSKTIKLNPSSAPKAEKKLKWYDDLARDFGFGRERMEMYGHDEEFHSRAAGSRYHRVRSLIS